MANIEHQRWATALSRVKKIERKSRLLNTKFFPRTFSYASRSAWATPGGLAILPKDQQQDPPGAGEIRGSLRAESILIGKFDVQSEVRLRAFYPDRNLSIRYQAGGANNGVIRTVKAFEQIAPYAPNLMPQVYEHGEILKGRGAYLVEDTVPGETATRAQLEELILPLTEQLHRAQRGSGITDRNLSEVLGLHAWNRWADFVEMRHLDSQFDHTVQSLLKRDHLLETSVTHGDLVNSNILVNGSDFVLVDWEWASIKPIAFDMAKIIINVSNIDDALASMHKGLGGLIGTNSKTHYSFREQVALALVQTLTFYRRQAAKAKKAKRIAPLERQTKKRLTALRQLLELE